MLLLDTDTLSHFHAGNKKLAKRIQQVGGENVGITIIAAVEVLRGRQEYLLKAVDGAHLLKAQQLLNRSKAFLEDIPVVHVNAAVAAEFDRLRLDKKLRKIGRADLLIACFALALGATLVTRNVKHYAQVPRLRIENWID